MRKSLVNHEACTVHCEYTVHGALCTMHGTLCTVHSARGTVHCAQCTVRHRAPCNS